MASPVVLELAGPAGAGKTTLSNSLRELGVLQLPDRPSIRMPSNLSFFLGTGLRLLPTLLRLPRDGRWYSQDEIARMLYLTGFDRVVRNAGREARAVALDHGPVFQMAYLREFGPERLKRPSFERWWNGSYHRWARTLNLVVWLDAPDEVLIERVLNREQRHDIKSLAEPEARSLLHRYRDAHSYALSRLNSESPLRVLRLSTESFSRDQVTQRVLDEIATASGRGRSRITRCHSIDPVGSSPVSAARDANR
ncbi:MAG: hypothetical protein AMS19_11160 [Gemmatimonas sp. SG8_23]|nr:MAG: hypothetical protein AMS19_11160 [Gemmatimonas sp. SG8_23]